MDSFLQKLAEILEVDGVKETDILSSFDQWDSLTTLTIIATIDADFNVNISAEELASLVTVRDLVTAIENKRK